MLSSEEEREMIPQCLDQGVGLIPCSPLAQRYLAGTRARDGRGQRARAAAGRASDALYGRPRDFKIVDQVVKLANVRGVAPAQVALSWNRQTARGRRADHRRHHDRAGPRCGGGGRPGARGRRDRGAGAALPAPRGGGRLGPWCETIGAR
ncbi:MAG: aldo/keto reductase [Solirubrobacteraceae bacterium]